MIDLPLRALSDPSRREILKLLGEGPMRAGEIARRFEIGMPTVSHHLSVLKLAGLVRVERQGRVLMYSLEPQVLHEFLWELLDYFGAPERPPARTA